MPFEDIVKILISQTGLAGALLFFLVWYYDRRIRPAQERKDAELAAINASLIKDQIEENRRQRDDAFKREQEIRHEHAEAWEARSKQYREERDRDLIAQEKMIDRIAMAIDLSALGQDRNTGLLLALGRNQGMRKTDMIKEAELITGRPIDGKYATSSDISPSS